jgi:DNA polymerase I-like protein with 3'-5' exonuclease and polymerase domains
MSKPRPAHVGGQQMPLSTPESVWQPPKELPDLRRCQIVALDREVRDDGLSAKRGPGWAYRAGHVCGMSAAWDGGAFYAPIRHPESECFDAQRVADWERDHARAGVRFVYHNASYDLGWGKVDLGVDAPERIDDTIAMAVMVDENRLSYALDDLCAWRGLPGKDDCALAEAAAAYGYHGDAIKANIWRYPARYVGPYAEQDAVSTLGLYRSLLPELKKQDLDAAYRLEMDLVPMVMEMRRRGIKINTDRALSVQRDLYGLRDRYLGELGDKLNHTIGLDDVRSARRLETFFDAERVDYPRTPKSRVGSFDKEWMERHEHWLPQLVVKIRQAEDAASKFIGEYLLGYAHGGRIHASINQFRGEEGGTRSHRFSYSDPPLQQMPGDRYPELRDAIRGLFEPESGEEWASLDMSQDEYRMIVHYAHLLRCSKAAEVVRRYQEDPGTDFHAYVAEITGLPRKLAKNVNFAKVYGAGPRRFSEMVNTDEDEAKEIMDQYDVELPFPRELASICQRKAEMRGYIRLIDGARCHFDMWESTNKHDQYDAQGNYQSPRPLEAAQKKWPERRLRRAFCHKAFNRLIQGGCARKMKMAMLECWREGIVPLLQMHDELDFSIQGRSTADRAAEIMRTVTTLEVPMMVDIKTGPNWGAVR